MSNSEVKIKEVKKEEVKLISISREEFNEKVEDKLTVASYKELSKDRDSKGLINISKLDVVANKLRPSIIREVSSKYRIKGTRSGHMNGAPANVLSKVEEINNLIEQCPDWGSKNKDGEKINVGLGLIVKEVK